MQYWWSGNLSHTITIEISWAPSEFQRSSSIARFLTEREMLDDHISGTETTENNIYIYIYVIIASVYIVCMCVNIYLKKRSRKFLNVAAKVKLFLLFHYQIEKISNKSKLKYILNIFLHCNPFYLYVKENVMYKFMVYLNNTLEGKKTQLKDT